MASLPTVPRTGRVVTIQGTVYAYVPALVKGRVVKRWETLDRTQVLDPGKCEFSQLPELVKIRVQNSPNSAMIE